MTEEKLGKEELENSFISLVALARAGLSFMKTQLSMREKQAINQIKALIEGRVSDKFVEKWTEEFFEVLPNGISSYIKRLLEDYHKELMK